MAFRSSDAEEALRWKRKFLDALEEHEQREKNLSNRIRLLRRGLLGVSLAGDGLDSQLDKQLAELRKSLRNDDREVGLELLLEKIEQSILRLDNQKSQSHLALQAALSASLSELNKLPLSAAIRRQIKGFSANLGARIEDPEQHAGLIRQFMEIVQRSVDLLVQQEQTRQAELAAQSDKPSGGFWQRLFSTEPTPQDMPSDMPQSPFRQQAWDGQASERREDNVSDPVAETGPDSSYNPSMPEPPIDIELAEFEEVDESEVVPATTVQQESTLEGEVLRDRSGLQEPAFSYIAGHIEPLLLRILETIHISAESFELADSLRRTIIKGLNWYDFVAVLEEILHILRTAADEQRAQFQDFLTGVTESLAHVQAFVDQAKQQTELADSNEQAMDLKVREQVAGIAMSLQAEVIDLPSLKASVQAQVSDILSALDGFKQSRTDHKDDLAKEMHLLVERITALENESRELRLHLARQQEAATYDTLTELPNRSSYNQRLRELLEQWHDGPAQQRREEDRGLCLAVADVDHFKSINDTYGHLAGDKVLKIIAREMAARLRDKDFVARYGGEEFVIILPDTRPADAEYVLNKLREAISAIPFHFKETKVEITVSFGVAAANPEDTAESLFERADQALYSAKQQGRNRVIRAR